MSYETVQGDLDKPLPITLLDNGSAVDLSLADSVELRWTKPDKTTSVVSLTTVDAVTGKFQRDWAAGDTDQIGVHYGQVVTTIAGKPLTYPNNGTFIVWNVYRQLP